MVLGQTFREVATPIHRLEPMASINSPPPQVPGGGHTKGWHCRPPTPELVLCLDVRGDKSSRKHSQLWSRLHPRESALYVSHQPTITLAFFFLPYNLSHVPTS